MPRTSERPIIDWHIRAIAREAVNKAKGCALIAGTALGAWVAEAIEEKYQRELGKVVKET